MATTAVPVRQSDQSARQTPPTPRSWWRTAVSLPDTRWASLSTGLFLLGGAVQLAGGPAPVFWGLYLVCSAVGGWEPARSGLEALRRRTLDVDLLMVVAAVVAAGIGQVTDGALLIVIFATSGAVESFVARRTADSVHALLDLAPQRATRLGPTGEHVVDAIELSVGDLVLVRPGERIGADGMVTDGASEVDQSTITGEPLPVVKGPGAEVFAGTVNGTGALRIRVTRAAHESVVARIVALVTEAAATKAHTQLRIDRIEQRYSVGVVVATLALFVVPLLLGEPILVALLRAITFMIVASPCGVVLATMPPLLATIANAGRHGVLVKSAVALEQLARVDVVAFDKTGTLTAGVPEVVDVVSTTLTGDELLSLAAAAEHPSEHPLGRAVVRTAQARGLPVAACQDFTSTPGQGVTAVVDGRLVQVGDPTLLTSTAAGSADLEKIRPIVERIREAGKTAVVVMRDGVAQGVLGLADRARPDARRTVTAVAAATGRLPLMLTGDNHTTAARLGEQVGITDIRAGLLPADKADHIAALRTAGHTVMLVGDGVNDAPAMATADVGVAMGGHGSDLARQTADMIIVRDELSALPAVIALAHRAQRMVTANLVIAAAIITALVVWDVVGTLPMPLGVLGHEGSTVLVALNGLRLLRPAAWRRAAPRTRPETAANDMQ